MARRLACRCRRRDTPGITGERGANVRQINRSLVGEANRVGGRRADLDRIRIINQLNEHARDALPERAGFSLLRQTLDGD